MKLLCEHDFRIALEMHASMVYRLAYARTGNAAYAEDICQDVFLSLSTKNPDFETADDMKAWLIRVTINRANSLWRTAWRRRVILDGPLDNGEEESQEDLMIREALSALSGKDRILIQLHYFEGYKLEEIAKIQRKSSATVRSQLHRVHKKLRKILKEARA